MKKKKANKPSPQKENPKLWGFRDNPNIEYSDHCVIKSWRFPNRKCATTSSQRPTLIEVHGKHQTSWRFPNRVYKRSAYWSPNGNASLTSYYAVAMLVTGDCNPAFAFNIIRGMKWSPWTIKNCQIKEPHDPSQNMRFLDVIGFKGRFYAMSLQGIVVLIEEEDAAGSDRFGITRTGGNRVVPSKACTHFRQYLVESHGEILAVFLVSSKSMNVVDDVEVFRLDTEKLLWVQLGNIGERALVLDDKDCVKLEVSLETEFKRNCVYFTHPGIQEWFVFYMETRLILPACFRTLN